MPEKNRAAHCELYLRRFARHAGSAQPSELLSPPPRTILLSLTTPRHEIPGWPVLEELLATRYREVLHLSVGDDPVGLFEPDGGTAALKVTYASPWRQTRPGPALALYELVDPPLLAGGNERGAERETRGGGE